MIFAATRIGLIYDAWSFFTHSGLCLGVLTYRVLCTEYTKQAVASRWWCSVCCPSPVFPRQLCASKLSAQLIFTLYGVWACMWHNSACKCISVYLKSSLYIEAPSVRGMTLNCLRCLAGAPPYVLLYTLQKPAVPAFAHTPTGCAAPALSGTINLWKENQPN